VNTPPTVSIILPTYNRAPLLPRAVTSALSQTYADFELIIVDDGSSDDTPTVVAGFTDRRIVYLPRRHEGAAAAENAGLAIARGRFIGFLDDDDEWLPGKLAAQVAAFAEEPPETGVVYTGRWRLQGGRRSYGPSPRILRKNGAIHREIVRRTTHVSLVCALVRRECFDEVGGFDESLPTSNDYDLWIRMSRRYRFRYLPDPLVLVHATAGSMSNDPRLIIEARKRLLVKHAATFRECGGGMTAYFLWQIGSLLIFEGDLREGRRYFARAARTRPWNPLYPASLLLASAGRGAYLNGLLRPLRQLRQPAGRRDYLKRLLRPLRHLKHRAGRHLKDRLRWKTATGERTDR
jgi:glycosyltransferase involved in cell wall biosynthesis